MNPGYFPLAATAPKPQQIPMFLNISAKVWGRRWSPHTSEQKGSGYVKTAIIHQLKRLCVPDCAYTESMFINFIHTSLYDIPLMQNILYQIKRDMAVWNRLGCPQRNGGNTIYGVSVIASHALWEMTCEAKLVQSKLVQFTHTLFRGFLVRIPMMTSSKGNIFRVTGLLCGEFTGHHTKASDAGVLIFSLIWAWINSSVNKSEAGYLRRHRTNYDVTAMLKNPSIINHQNWSAELKTVELHCMGPSFLVILFDWKQNQM